MIKFIYFDVGGVVIKDFSKTKKWDEFMGGLGIKRKEFSKFERFWKSLNVDVRDEMASIISLTNKDFGLQLPSDYDLMSDFVNNFEKNETIWPVIRSAKRKYKVGLLTNMYPDMFSSIEKSGLLPPVKWDIIIDSSIEKVAKPDKEIFVLAQKRASVEPKEILFIENSKSHVEAASKMKWNTFLYDSSDYEQSSKKLASYLNLK